MAIHYEIEPTSKREKIIEQVLNLKDLVDKINVPENPLGLSKPSSLAISILIKELGMEPIMHLRTRDRNFISLKSELYGALLFDIKEVLIVKGDVRKEDEETYYNKMSLESIIERLKNDEKISKIKLGLPLTVFEGPILEKRIASKADFLVTLQIESPKEIQEDFLSVIRKSKKELHVYYVLTSSLNRDLLWEIGIKVKEKSIDEHLENVKNLEEIVDAVVISCPRDFEFLLSFLRKYKKR